MQKTFEEIMNDTITCISKEKCIELLQQVRKQTVKECLDICIDNVDLSECNFEATEAYTKINELPINSIKYEE